MPSGEYCHVHGEAIASILANTSAMRDHLATLNGRTGKGEERIAALTVKQGAHDVIQTNMMRTLMTLETEAESMKTELSELRGGRRGALAVVQQVFTIVTLLMAMAGIYLSHQSNMQAKQIQQAQQAGQSPSK